ncbi:MAG: GIY-YIG nuclease family protein [Rhodospirillales bacterium]|jgi:predicted GIY-YIG superfamily endonuclease|nr:GIY-YIG nuclease family protein [Rhodospirillales bacterium]
MTMGVKHPAMYIVASGRNGTLHTGVTSDLLRRVHQHREGLVQGFARHRRCRLLVYLEVHEDMLSAIAREKQIKAGSRKKKLGLIEGLNPQWPIFMKPVSETTIPSSRAAQRRGDPV